MFHAVERIYKKTGAVRFFVDGRGSRCRDALDTALARYPDVSIEIEQTERFSRIHYTANTLVSA